MSEWIINWQEIILLSSSPNPNFRRFHNLQITHLFIYFIISMIVPGGALGYFWADMCRPGLQIGTPF